MNAQENKVKRHEYYVAHKDNWKQYSANGIAKFPNRGREIANRYYWRHRDKIIGTRNAYLKDYVKKHSDRIKANRRQYYIDNKEKLAAYNTANSYKYIESRKHRAAIYRADHRDQLKAKGADYRERNRLKIRVKNKAWKLANPGLVLESKNRRRLKMKSQTVDFKKVQDLYVFIRSQIRIACCYCGVLVSGKDVHIDHIVPLSRGGAHSVENLCATCPSCNMAKHDKLVSEWKPELSSKSGSVTNII